MVKKSSMEPSERVHRGAVVRVDSDKYYTADYLKQFADDNGDVHVLTMPDRSKG